MGYNGNVVIVDTVHAGSRLYIYGHSRAISLPDSVAYAIQTERKDDVAYLPRVIVTHMTRNHWDDGLSGVGISATRMLGDCPDIEIDPTAQRVRYSDPYDTDTRTAWVPYQLFVDAVKAIPAGDDYDRPERIIEYIRARS